MGWQTSRRALRTWSDLTELNRLAQSLKCVFFYLSRRSCAVSHGSDSVYFLPSAEPNDFQRQNDFTPDPNENEKKRVGNQQNVPWPMWVFTVPTESQRISIVYVSLLNAIREAIKALWCLKLFWAVFWKRKRFPLIRNPNYNFTRPGSSSMCRFCTSLMFSYPRWPTKTPTWAQRSHQLLWALYNSANNLKHE